MTSKTLTVQLSELQHCEGRAARRVYLSDSTLKSLRCVAGDPVMLQSVSDGGDESSTQCYAVGSAWPSLDLGVEGAPFWSYVLTTSLTEPQKLVSRLLYCSLCAGRGALWPALLR